MAMRLKKGDTVIVRSGALKGKTGKVSEVHPKVNMVTIDGLNVVKRHRKSQSNTDPGGVFEKSMPLAVSKVGIVHHSKKGQASRIGFEVSKDGKKKRVYKATGKEIK